MLKSQDLQETAEDFRYLLNRRYPRRAALELVGNRYQLTADERHLLHRGVFAERDAGLRRSKKISMEEARNKELAIDGYNVVITVESGLSGRPLVLGDDGFIRDISGLSKNFKKSKVTEEALQLIFDTLKNFKPRRTLFLFDAPISKSGKLAQEIRDRLKRENLPGDAQAVKVPEKTLIGFAGVVATSDTAIVDQSHQVVDLAGDILSKEIKLHSLIRWKRKRGSVGKR
jgi:hypothetical protein